MEKLCGIYKITNSVNDKVYIGRSTDLERRWSTAKKYQGFNNYLMSAFKKYGLSQFKFQVLKVCTRENLDGLWQFYIRAYCSFDQRYGYNLTYGESSQRVHGRRFKLDESAMIDASSTTMDVVSMTNKTIDEVFLSGEDLNDLESITKRTRVRFLCKECGRHENTNGGDFKLNPKLLCRYCKKRKKRCSY